MRAIPSPVVPVLEPPVECGSFYAVRRSDMAIALCDRRLTPGERTVQVLQPRPGRPDELIERARLRVATLAREDASVIVPFTQPKEETS